MDNSIENNKSKAITPIVISRQTYHKLQKLNISRGTCAILCSTNFKLLHICFFFLHLSRMKKFSQKQLFQYGVSIK